MVHSSSLGGPTISNGILLDCEICKSRAHCLVCLSLPYLGVFPCIFTCSVVAVGTGGSIPECAGAKGNRAQQRPPAGVTMDSQNKTVVTGLRCQFNKQRRADSLHLLPSRGKPPLPRPFQQSAGSCVGLPSLAL